MTKRTVTFVCSQSFLNLFCGRCQRLSRLEILSKVWGYTLENSVDTRVVNVHVSRLRDKLQESPQQAELIITVRGKGYAFQRQECTA